MAVVHENHVYTANLGDSGFLLYRRGNIVLRSEVQTHSFNCPFQLGTNSGDKPSLAATSQAELEKGDVLLLGTDGLFDNLFDHQIIKFLSAQLSDQNTVSLQQGRGGDVEAEEEAAGDPQAIAVALAQHAHYVSLSGEGTTPFAYECSVNGYNDVRGGKPDDITVVIGIVS